MGGGGGGEGVPNDGWSYGRESAVKSSKVQRHSQECRKTREQALKRTDEAVNQ